jgi:structural maintenance of chromosome 2
VDESKATIENLQRSVQDAKDKQMVAQEEVKNLERDMEEFKNNKEGKIEELKVSLSIFNSHPPLISLSQANISKQKAALQKHAVVLKTEHKELQTAALELGEYLW